MKKILVFNNDGEYLEDKIVGNGYDPSDNEYIVDIDTSLSFHKPKLVNGEVVEGLTQSEVDNLKSRPVKKTQLEILKETVDMLVLESLEE